MTKYEKALLDLIAYTEGTLGVSNNGYDVTVNFHLIIGWTPDTNIVHGLNDWKIKLSSTLSSTAAGRYQFLGKTWTGSWVGGTKKKKGQNVPMTKDNQDIAALWLVNKRLKSTAIDSRKVTIGEMGSRSKFDIVLQKLAPEWASIPLTKTIVYKGKTKKAGDGFYAGQKARHSPNELWEIYNKALALYS